ncbi:MAG: DUF1877 family protein [Kofleriaceae bacterium]
MYGVMITLSPKRLTQLESDPETLEDVLEARHETEIPGLLDLGVTWDALDVILSDRGKDAVLGDAVLGRSGRPLAVEGSFQSARVLDAKRVAEVAKKLEGLGATHVKDRYPSLAAAKVHGKLGAQPDDEECEGLEIITKRLVAIYKDAARQNHQMLVMIVT